MTTFIINSKRSTSHQALGVEAETQAEYPIFEEDPNKVQCDNCFPFGAFRNYVRVVRFRTSLEGVSLRPLQLHGVRPILREFSIDRLSRSCKRSVLNDCKIKKPDI